MPGVGYTPDDDWRPAVTMLLPPPPPRTPAARRWIAGWTLVAAALRAVDLAGQSLWSDEDITLDRARTALGALLAGLPGEQAPLYFVVARAFTRLAGESDLALRFPSLLAGVAAVPLGYAVARRLTDAPTARAVAVLLACNPFLVSYGQEARMYALVGALSLGALAAALAADAAVRAGRPARGRWLACGALTAATVYTHYYGLLVVATLAAWGLPDVVAAARARWRGAAGRAAPAGDATVAARARGWLGAAAVAALLFAPWLPRALQVAEHPGWREPLPRWRIPDMLAVAYSAQTGVTAGRPPDAVAASTTALSLALLAIGVGAWWAAARGAHGGPARRGAWRALAWLGAMAAVAAVAVVRTPDIHPRYLFPIVGAWCLAIAAGGRALAGRFGPAGWLPLAALVGLGAVPLAAHATDPAARKTDYRRLTAVVVAGAPASSSRLFLDGPALGLTERYVPPDSALKVENLRSDKNTALRAADPVSFTARLDDLARRRPHLWLASDGAAAHAADAWLAAHAYPVTTTAVGDVTLARWFVPPAAAGDDVVPDATGAVDPAATAAGGDLADLATGPDALVAVAKAAAPDGAVAPPPIALDVLAPNPGADAARPGALAVRPGDVVAVALRWRPGADARPPWSETAPTRRPHHVSVRLVDDAGAVHASADRAPAAGAAPTTVWRAGDAVLDRHGLIVPSATPPGRYRLAVVLYDAATLAPAFTWSGLVAVTVEAAP